MILLQMFTRQRVATTFLVILAASLFVRLGIWQLARLEQRRAFNAHYLESRALPPLELPALGDLASMEYRPVMARGVYDFDHQIALRNQYHELELGYELFTPLILADGRSVLVDRGWIPAAGNSGPAFWRAYDQPGEVAVLGTLRLGSARVEPAAPISTPGEAAARIDFWSVINIAQIDAQIPESLLPAYVQLDPDPGRSEPPIPSQVEMDLSEGPHFSYAVQWFGFAAASVAGYAVYLHRQESRSQS